MKILSVENITKTYGEKVLFNNITFHITEKDKIGIIGINGTGKSSLLQILAQVDEQYDGNINHPKDYTIAYLPQDPELDASITVLDQVFQSKAEIIQLMNAYEHALIKLTEKPDNKQSQVRFFEIQKQMDSKNGWDASTRAKTILSKLGIHDLSQRIGSLSGGQKKRVALAQVLIEQPDLLLLDEPTNHLDVDSINWLESYIKSYPNAVITVTHDRYFLDQIATRIIELANGKLYQYDGNYESYLEAKALREEEEIRLQDKRKNVYRQELAWMRRGARARSTKQKARIQRFEKLEEQVMDFETKKGMDIALEGSRLGKNVFEFKNVSKRFNEKLILDNFNILINRRDRIGIIGENGSGKSTLLNILAGNTPIDQGEIIKGTTVKIGYYRQEKENIEEDMRMINYIRDAGEVVELANGEIISAPQMLERFLFPPHTHGTMISRLSGGERRRLYLLKLLMEKPNVLLLDEPTNDLDTETLTILEQYIDDFPGVVISVSHDRYFLDKTAGQLLVFKGNGVIESFYGTYSEYLENTDHDIKKVKEQQSNRGAHVKEKKRKMTYKEKMEWETIEDKILDTEGKLESLNEELNSVGSNFEKAQELMEEIEQLNQYLEELISRWSYLSEINDL